MQVLPGGEGVSAQAALDFSARPAETPPAGHLKDAIRAEVAALIAVNAQGSARAVTGETLAAWVDEALRGRGIQHSYSAGTLLRRCQEAVAELVERGVSIASTCSKPRGYYVPDGEADITKASRQFWRRVRSSVQRGRHFDRNTADQLLAILGQLHLDDAGRADS